MNADVRESAAAESEGRDGGTARSGALPHGDLFAGKLVDNKYRLLSHLGSGGMGTVFLAEHIALGKRCALKFLRADEGGSARAIQRFRREAQLLAKLEHQNIVSLFDLGTQGEQPYLVLELIRGHTLRREMNGGRLSTTRLLEILTQIARALGAAHDAGVLHRDLKPENVMLSEHADGRVLVKLLDFGVARWDLDEATHLTLTGQAPGTAAYMSPEQARGEPQLDARSDVYALGVIAYEMLVGKRPHVGSSYNETLFRVLNQAPLAPTLQRPELPLKVDAVFERALAKHANDRYGSAWALVAALRDALATWQSDLDTADQISSELEHEPSQGGYAESKTLAVARTRVAWHLPLAAVTGAAAGVLATWLLLRFQAPSLPIVDPSVASGVQLHAVVPQDGLASSAPVVASVATPAGTAPMGLASTATSAVAATAASADVSATGAARAPAARAPEPAGVRSNPASRLNPAAARAAASHVVHGDAPTTSSGASTGAQDAPGASPRRLLRNDYAQNPYGGAESK